MGDALSVAEAGIAAVREAESKAGAAFRLLVEQNDAQAAEIARLTRERDHAWDKAAEADTALCRGLHDALQTHIRLANAERERDEARKATADYVLSMQGRFPMGSTQANAAHDVALSRIAENLRAPVEHVDHPVDPSEAEIARLLAALGDAATALEMAAARHACPPSRKAAERARAALRGFR